jgi:hypothetical protein
VHTISALQATATGLDARLGIEAEVVAAHRHLEARACTGAAALQPPEGLSFLKWHFRILKFAKFRVEWKSR